MISKPSKASLARMKKAAEGGAELKEEVNVENPPNLEAVDQLMSFLDPDGDGISREELTAGFRQGRRARSTAKAETMGRRIFKVMLKKLGDKEMDVEVSEREGERRYGMLFIL